MSSIVGKLRPEKVRGAIRRRMFERSLAGLPLEPATALVELGSRYGGWQIPDGVLDPKPICYCVGSGDDISFDLDLIKRYDANVRAVDPVEEYEPRVLEAAAGDPRFTYRRAALALADGPIRMQTHHESASASLSAAGLYDTADWHPVDGLTLASLMREFGDERIDLLKIDIEGLEYELIPSLDLRALGVVVFAFQLHHTGTPRQAREVIELVRAQGYKLVAQRPVVKLGFCRADRAGGRPSPR